MLQSVLTGKAREIYSALSVKQSSRYDAVKSAIPNPTKELLFMNQVPVLRA